MFSRNNQEEMGQNLPESWIKEVCSTLNEVYQSHFKLHNKKVEVYGFAYPNELLLIISLLDNQNDNKAPTTYLCSVDVTPKEQPLQLLHFLVDASGIFLDSYFSTPDWNDYCLDWQEVDHQKIKFFYKTTRENIALSIEASELLARKK